MEQAVGAGRRRGARWLPRSLWVGRRKLTTRGTAEQALEPVRLERLSV
jgi:hypothetical protein